MRKRTFKSFIALLASSCLAMNMGMTAVASHAAEETYDKTLATTGADVTTYDGKTESENFFTAVISLMDSETKKPFENNVDVRFMEYEADLYVNPNAALVREIASWNTSDTNPCVIPDIPFINGHYYCVEIDELPAGYSFNGYSASISTGIHGSGVLSGEQQYTISVNHAAPITELEFPLSIVRPSTFSIVDYDTKESIDDIHVTLVELNSAYKVVSEVAEWNTSDTPCYAIDLPYYWKDEYASCYYGLAVDSLPDDYNVEPFGTTADGKKIITTYRYSALNYKVQMEYGYLDKPDDYVLSLRQKDSDTKVTTGGARTTTTTTVKTTSAESSTGTTTTTTEDIAGDANCDGTVDLADAVLIMQYYTNPDRYGLGGSAENCMTPQGMKNADVDGDGNGITNMDALKIQMFLVGIIDDLK